MNKHQLNYITNLIVRLEQAQCADQVLDEEIDRILYPDIWLIRDSYAPEPDANIIWNYNIPRYTGSADAALMLVPEDWRVHILSEWDNQTLRNRGAWQCILGRAGEGDNFGGKFRCDHASTPAIAICIAAIKVITHQHTIGVDICN